MFSTTVFYRWMPFAVVFGKVFASGRKAQERKDWKLVKLSCELANLSGELESWSRVSVPLKLNGFSHFPFYSSRIR